MKPIAISAALFAIVARPLLAILIVVEKNETLVHQNRNFEVSILTAMRELEKCVTDFPSKFNGDINGKGIFEYKTGVRATWYGEAPDECIGYNPDLIMSNGERYDELAYTAAANFLPLDSHVRVRYGNNEIIVRVTDRMLSDTKIDLSKAAFESLAPLGAGIITVSLLY